MALTAMHNAISLTIHGQMQDSDSAHHSVAQYAEIAANKSGPLLALPVCLALIAADAPGQDIALRAARALAVAYQSLDDLADKSLDKVNGSVNICLLLEASGLTPAEAAASTCSRAYGALKTARREAKSLTRAVGTPFLQLADRLDQQLKDTNNAN
jgi:geranylgeranyl diphosphate synthase type II